MKKYKEHRRKPSVCFYFQVHQPFRLRDLRISDIGTSSPAYFDNEKNAAIFRKVAEKCYLPSNALLRKLLTTYPDFSVAFSLSGTFLDQCALYGADVLKSFKELAATGKVEFLAETYYHSLSFLHSLPEFCLQVGKHVNAIQENFGQTPTIFRNTELIYNNELAHVARLMGFHGILAEGADHVLQGKTPNIPYIPPSFRLPPEKERIIRMHRPLSKRLRKILVLLKNYQLSDDIAFRFSDHSWNGFPLTAERFTEWLLGIEGHSVNLFMDYETFGEHQWQDTGIFHFLEALPKLLKEHGISTKTPSQAIATWQEKETPTLDAHAPMSWADTERDLSAWQGNIMQKAALESLYAMEAGIASSGDAVLLSCWRRLQTSDHFYYMCTKYWNDGDVHKYFSPYESPYEAYRRFSHALCDLHTRLTH